MWAINKNLGLMVTQIIALLIARAKKNKHKQKKKTLIAVKKSTKKFNGAL